MANEKIVKTLLSYGVDESSIQRVLRANDSIKDSLADIERAAKELNDTRIQAFEKRGVEARREFDALRASLNESSDEAQKLAGSFKDVETAANAAARASNDAGNVQTYQRADTTASRTSTILSGVGLGGLSEAAGLLSDLSAAAAESGGSLTAAATAFGVTTAAAAAIALPLAAATAGVTFIFDEIQRGVERARKDAALFAQGAEISANTNAEIRDLLRRGDKEFAEDRLAQLRDDQQRINEALQSLEGQRAVLRDELGMTNEQILGRANAFGGPGATIAAQVAKYQELTDIINSTLTGSLDPVLQLITGITTEVLPALSGIDVQSFQSQIDAIQQRTQQDLLFYQLSQTASAEALQTRLQNNRVEINALSGQASQLQALGSSNEDVQASLDATITRIDELTRENQQLEQSLIPIAQAREAEIEANKRYEQAAAASIRLTNQLADLQVQQREAENQLQAQRNRELEDFQRNRNYQIGDFYDNLGEQDASFNERQAKSIEDFKEAQAEADSERLDAIQQFNADSAKAAQDLQRDLRRIREDGDESVLESAANLDARGVLAAQRATEKALRDRQEAYNEETKERQEQLEETLEKFQEETDERKKNFEQQLKDQRDAFQKQRNAQVLDFAERLRREDENRQIRRQRENEDDAIRRQRYQQQQDELRTQLETQNAILRTGYNAMIVASNAFTNQLIANANSLTGGSGGGGGTGGGGDTNSDFLAPASFRTSSFPSASGIASFPSSSSMSSTANNISININGSSGDPVAIATAVRREMISVFNGIAGRR